MRTGACHVRRLLERRQARELAPSARQLAELLSYRHAWRASARAELQALEALELELEREQHAAAELLERVRVSRVAQLALARLAPAQIAGADRANGGLCELERLERLATLAGELAKPRELAYARGRTDPTIAPRELDGGSLLCAVLRRKGHELERSARAGIV
jgi:hypothetical protein